MICFIRRISDHPFFGVVSFLIIALLSTVASAQAPSKEYIRLGGRVIAIENGGVAVSVTPTAVSLTASQTKQFSALVSGTSNTAVTWSLNPTVGTIDSTGLYAAPATITGTQAVVVTATSVADATKSATATITLTLGTNQGCWTGVAVGAGSASDAFSYSNGVFTVTGAGGINNVQDSFEFVSCTLTGDGTLVARLVSQTGASSGWSNIGIMMRSGLAATAPSVFIGLSGSQLVSFTRSTAGASATQTNGPSAGVPYWLKLVRTSGVVHTYYSPTGATDADWTELVPTGGQITLTGTVYAGLVSDGGFQNSPTTDVVDNVIWAAGADFYLTNWPVSWSSSAAGDTGTYGIGVEGINGFSSSVSFTVTNLPQGASAILNPPTVTGSSQTSLTVTVPPGAPAGTYSFNINATGGGATHSTAASITVISSAPTTLPFGWQAAQVGTPDATEVASYANGVFTVTSDGQINSNSDQFEFAYQPLTGDGTLVARLVSQAGASAGWSNIGIMMRSGLAVTTPNVFIGLSGAQLLSFTRSTSGATSTKTNGPSAGVPYWLKLVRTSGVVHAYYSATGATADWTELVPSGGQITLTGTVYAGLVSDGSLGNGPTTATFDNVNIANGAGSSDFSLGLPTEAQELIAGESLNVPATIVTSGGFNSPVNFAVNGLPASTTAVFSPATVTGTGDTTMLLNSSTSTLPNNYSLTVTASGGTTSHNGTVMLTVDPVGTQPPAVTSVVPASGTGANQTFTFTITDPVSANNLDWMEVLINGSLSYSQACYLHYDSGTNTIYLADNVNPVWIGSSALATTGTLSNSQCTLDTGKSSASISGTQLTLNLALTFSGSFNGQQNIYGIADDSGLNSAWQYLGSWGVPLQVGALPFGWQAAQVGTPDATEVASYANGVFTVTSDGQINSNSDQFEFAYQPLTGDGTLVARLVNQAGASAGWSNIGIMMRSGLAATAPNVFIGLSGPQLLSFTRSTSGATSTKTNGPSAGVPYWLKLVRTSGVVHAYYSATGATADWTELVPTGGQITLTGTVYAGLVSDGGFENSPITATFDNVTLATGPDFYLIDSQTQPIRVNAGAGAYTDPGGIVWSADFGTVGGSASSTSNSIANTPTPVIYQTQHYNTSNLQYQFSVPNGTYTVNLKFAEIVFTQTGQRIFSAAINGTPVLSNFDIVAAAGGPNIAIDEPFTTTVTNGTITILLTPGTSNPAINAIEIIPNPAMYSLALVPLYGFSGTAALSVSGLPANAAANFNPGTVTPSISSVLTITPASGTPPGNYPLVIYGNSGAITRLTDASLLVLGTPAAPTFSPTPGTYSLPQSVAVSSSTTGALISYTTDGTTPSSTNGALYSSPILVSNGTTTIKAVTLGTGSIPSALVSGTYVIGNASAAAAPTFSPTAGGYSTSQSVSLSSTTSGAVIHYTTDGSTPSGTSGTLYTGAITVATTTTIRAVASASGMADSSVVLATYTINPVVAMPTFSPSGGIFMTAQTVTISSTTSGAAIRYTTDGTTPTPLTGTVYTGPITVSASLNLQAIAYDTHFTPSAIATAKFAIETYCKAGSINHAMVSGTSALVNYPLLVSVTDPAFRTTANGGGVGKVDGTDISFAAADGTTKLDHELELYNPTTGQLIAWVRIPSLSPTADTVFSMCYGSASASDQQNIPGVWDSSFQAVYHLKENAANTYIADSTSHAYSGTAFANTSSKQTQGQIDGALNFNGVSDNIISGNFVGPAHNVTIEAWVKPSNTSSAYIILQGGSAGDGYLRLETSGPHYRTFFGNGGWGSTTGTDSTASVTTSWTHLVSVHDHTNNATYLYINGVLDINASDTIDPSPSPGLVIGSYTSGYDFPGVIDEVRVSGTARSAAWIATEYANESSPASFITYPPSPPTGLTATVGSGQVVLNWTASGGGGSVTYNVKRSTTTGGSYQVLATGVNSTSYTDTTVSNGTTYYYVVSAVNVLGESPNSSEISAIPVTPPTFSPGAGTYLTSQTVTISATPPGATIRYTTDGSTPTPSNGVLYTAPITLSSWTNLQAIAYMAASSPSNVASGVYAIEPHRKSITIDHTKVSGSSSLSNFPILFSVVDSDLRSSANGGSVANNSGSDILFTGSDGLTKLDHELEKYDPSTGTVVAWIRIPTLSTTLDTRIFIYYGSSTAPNEQNKTGVWDGNYVGVWHLPNGLTLTGNDSTANNNQGTINGATAVTGKIDGGANVSSGSVNTGCNASCRPGAGDFTISLWLQSTDTSLDVVLGEYNGTGDNYWLGNPPSLEISMNGSTLNSNTSVNDGSWHYAVVARSGSNRSIYIDGALKNSDTSSVADNPGGNLYIGAFGQAGGYVWHGSTDELRYSNSARSSGWIATEYNNQASPSTFFSVGTQQ